MSNQSSSVAQANQLLVPPHGSDQLVCLKAEGLAHTSWLEKSENMPSIVLSSREMGDLIMLGIGGFTPLRGFMGSKDWHGVVTSMKMESGLFWPIPITLSATTEEAEALELGIDVALKSPVDQKVVGILKLSEKYAIDKSLECQEVYKTTDIAHPGVKMVMEQGEVNLAGEVVVLSEGTFAEDYPGVYMTPAQTRSLFEEKSWKTVAAFQTRNPMHRSHEHLAKIAVELCDGVLVHSLLGNLKPGDIPADVRQSAIKTLLDEYFVPNTVVQSGYPLDMRYAGPREALLHALFRQNYGCSHLIVGRDHAGVGDYYGPFDAQHIFEEIPAGALLTQPIKIDWTFWCHKCENMASMRTCPHTAEDRVLVSGTKLRKALSEGEQVPDSFSRPEVLKILRKYYEGLEESQKVKVELKGHSAT